VRLHDLRPTNANFGAGAGPRAADYRKLQGQTNAATTQRYAHPDNDPLRKAANRIGGDIAAAMGEKVTGRSDEATDYVVKLLISMILPDPCQCILLNGQPFLLVGV